MMYQERKAFVAVQTMPRDAATPRQTFVYIYPVGGEAQAHRHVGQDVERPDHALGVAAGLVLQSKLRNVMLARELKAHPSI